MELRYLQPDLKQLAQSVSEILILPVYEGERPPRGVTGLVDYRLGGSISTLIKRGELNCDIHEQVLITGRPRLPFEKILLTGAGKKADFHPQVFMAIVDGIFATMVQLSMRRATIALPGRAEDLIEHNLAVELLRERAEKFPSIDSLTLVDRKAANSERAAG